MHLNTIKSMKTIIFTFISPLLDLKTRDAKVILLFLKNSVVEKTTNGPNQKLISHSTETKVHTLKMASNKCFMKM